MRIARKVDFRRMSLTKSLLLEGYWSLKTMLKAPVTLAWSRSQSNFRVAAKK